MLILIMGANFNHSEILRKIMPYLWIKKNNVIDSKLKGHSERMKLYGKIKLSFIFASVLVVLYIVRALPSSGELRLFAQKFVKSAIVVEMPTNFVTEHYRKKYFTEAFYLATRARNLSEAYTMTGVSFHSESGHIEILSKRLHKNEDYADSQHLSSTESIVKYEENNTNCYNLGDEGKSVSPQHYRTCIKMIMQDSLRLANLSKTNNKLLEMTERLRVYEQACRQPVAEVTGAPDFQDVVFDPKHKLSYCKTAKTGSSTILSFIFYIDDIDFDPRNQIGLHKAAQMTFPALPGRHGAWKMTNDAYTFTSVRHPFHRLVSAYCNKVVESKEHILKQHNHVMLSYRLANTLDIIRKELPNHYFEANDPSRRKASMLKLPRKFILSTPGKSKFLEIPGEPENLSPEVPSFREFMLFVALNILQCAGDHICLNELDTHFRPQVIRCNPCAWHFDFILKTETLQDDLVWLAGVVGATSAISSSHQRTRGTQLTGDIPKLNTSGGRCANYDQYMHALTSEEIDIFYSAYYYDFRYFGYQPFD